MYLKKREEKDLINKEEKDQCIICWDNKNVYKMQSFVLVTNTCSCDSTFHGSCLFNWVYQTQSCPICRKPCQFNIKLLKCFLKNKNFSQNQLQPQPFINPLNQIIELDITTNNNYITPKNALFIIYKFTLSILQFISCIFLYCFIISLGYSIRREMLDDTI
jgi:hypothetical protein